MHVRVRISLNLMESPRWYILSRENSANLDGSMVVHILRMLVPGIVGIVLNRRIDDSRNARSQQQRSHSHRPHSLHQINICQ